MGERQMLAGIPVEIVRKRIKNVYVRVVPPDGHVVVSCSQRVPMAELERFVGEHRDWIARQQAQLVAHPAPVPRSCVTGEELYLWGQRLALVVEEGARFGMRLELEEPLRSWLPGTTGFGEFREELPELLGRGALARTESVAGVARLRVPQGRDDEARRRWLRGWYRGQLQAVAQEFVPWWEQRTGLRCSSWSQRWMTSRWGTCNTRSGHILLNTQLAKHPLESLDYVVLHEICHLRVPNHGPAFHALLDRHMPDWRARRRALNERSFPWSE